MYLRLALGLGIGLAAWLLMAAKRKVFISYYYDGDRRYKNLLKAWSENSKFDIEFQDTSTDVSIKSENEKYIKKKISEKIKEADVFVVLIGVSTHKSRWVSWEVDKALEHNKKIIAIKENKNHISPKVLMSKGVTWVNGYKKNKIIEEFNNI